MDFSRFRVIFVLFVKGTPYGFLSILGHFRAFVHPMDFLDFGSFSNFL